MRNLKLIITIVASGIIAVLIIIWMSLSVSTKNAEVELKTQVYAQQKKCSTYFDKMWKILKEKAGVTDQYKDAFKDIYPKLIAGRYSGNGDGSLMKWVTESNPTFDASMYKDLMQSIEIERTGFNNEQERLIDLKREHDVMLQKIPSKWFLSDTIKPINIVLVTSSKTDDAYKTGKENDVELFDKKK
jgi:hypothetical protein